MSKTIGIIGGMGPLATCDLFRKIIEVTDAGCDQEHIRVCIDNNTQIPDRTAAILGRGISPVEEMVKSARRLRDMGANVLIMPCNTAHYFYKDVSESVEIPVLNMIEETAAAIQKKGMQHVGLLATDGTIQSGVYADVFKKMNITATVPSREGQKAVMDVIYKGVKAGNYQIDLTDFYRAVEELLDAGAETLVLGCTELPVAFQEFHIDKPFVDPTQVLALAAVQFVGKKVKDNML